ncbi:MAG TPA: sigma-70 family RNA polymerase sigma factor [Pseudonocardiaceae bacterium]|nr:sigma-70 family RNA polymerase sigma factor [Pseudonocardiaceae bacterium]
MTSWAVAAQRGDRDAAAAFIRATTGQLRRLLSYLADAGQVEDLVQETYLRAFAALPRYAQRSPARPWLLAIARRVAADQVRANQHSPRRAGGDWEYELDRRRSVADHSGAAELRHAIAALEPERREAFVLTRVMGLSYAEAAQACDCPVGTIRSRVFRARADLLDALRADEDPVTSAGP